MDASIKQVHFRSLNKLPLYDPTMKRVIIESPYAGDVGLNLRYLRACMKDCLSRDEAPFASHGLYTQEGVLNDDDATERRKGCEAGFTWREQADLTVVYIDLGISRGMSLGIEDAKVKGLPVEYRCLHAWATIAEGGS